MLPAYSVYQIPDPYPYGNRPFTPMRRRDAERLPPSLAEQRAALKLCIAAIKNDRELEHVRRELMRDLRALENEHNQAAQAA